MALQLKRIVEINKSKLAPYKPLLYFYSHLKQLYISNKTEDFSDKEEHGRTCIKAFKKLAWAKDKQLQVISII